MADNMIQVLEGLGSGGGCAGCRGGVGGLGALAAPGTVWTPGLVLAAAAIGAAWWLSRTGNNHRVNLGGRRRGLGGLGRAGARSYGSVLPAR